MGYTTTTWALCGIHSDHTGNTYWPCRHHRLMQHMVRHSDHMGIIWDTLWPYGIHSDHVNSTNQCNIWRDTLTTWAIYRDTLWPCEQYMVKHTEYVDRTDWHNISWDTLTTWAIYADLFRPCEQYESIHHIARQPNHTGQYTAEHTDQADSTNQCNIWWYTLTTWAIYGDLFQSYEWQTHWSHIRHSRSIAQHFDNMVNHIIINAFFNTGTMRMRCHHDTLWPHEHYVGYTLTTWAICTETCWPCRQHRLIQHIVRHSDHVGIIWDTLWPRGQYILKHTDH